MFQIKDFLDFLEERENWKDILSSAPYNIKIKEEGDFVLFKYNQIDSDFSNDFVNLCRGLIVKRESGCWKVVNHSFNKFFNFGEDNAAKIDWDSAVVTEKVDGTLINIWYADEWHFSTNGNISAFNEKCNEGRTFGQIFEKALKTYGYENFDVFTEKLNPIYCYTFELCSPENRIVIPYSDYRIYGLTKRNIQTDEEVPFWKDFSLRIDYPGVFFFSNLEEVKEAAKQLPWDEEGYVVCDKFNERIKVKSVQYVAAHYCRINNSVSDKKLLEIILNGEEEEFLVYCDDCEDRLNEIKRKIQNKKDKCYAVKDMLNLFETRKEKALFINAHFTGFLKDYLMSCAAGKDETFFENLKKSYWEKELFK